MRRLRSVCFPQEDVRGPYMGSAPLHAAPSSAVTLHKGDYLQKNWGGKKKEQPAVTAPSDSVILT